MFVMPETGGEAAKPCAGLPLDLFFPKHDGPFYNQPTGPERAALNVCATCPLASRRACLNEALKWPAYHQHGVVGGTTASQRRAIINGRKAEALAGVA
jgi:hypothetical protein